MEIRTVQGYEVLTLENVLLKISAYGQILIPAMAGITLLGTKVNSIFANVESGLPSGS